MFNFLKKHNDNDKDQKSTIAITALLIHAAKIDENYSEKEKQIIKKTLINLGSNDEDVDNIIKKAELAEKNSDQILEFTKEAKNLKEEDKVILVEALWTIIYSDENMDMYETNLMRRLSGLIYLDSKIVGDIKEKIKNKNNDIFSK